MYLDPSFGGMLIQIIVAVVAAGGVIAFSMRKKIHALFSKDKGGKEMVVREVNGTDISEGDVIDMLTDEEHTEESSEE